MTDQTKAPERIWVKNFPMRRRGSYAEGEFHSRWEERSSAETEYVRADLAAEQVKQAYERGIEAAATDQLTDALGNIAAMGYSEDAAVAKNIARAALAQKGGEE